MKKWSLLLAALISAAGASCSKSSPPPRAQSDLKMPPDLIAQIHFAGAEKISSDRDSRAFTNEFCSAEARTLESQTLDKLSRAPGVWFKSKISAGAGDGSAQLRPLLDDFLKSEWIFEMRDATNGSPEYALAIRLDNARAELWSKNLLTLLQNWTGISGFGKDLTWQIQKHKPPNLFQFRRSGDWIVLDCGQNKLSLGNEILDSLLKKKVAAAEKNWLSMNLNWPRLAQLFPALAKFDFPEIQMQVVGRDGNLHFNGKLNLSQPLAPFGKWQIPTNAIHQPLTSFTAARGFANWLRTQNWAKPFEISPEPNQVFVWSLGLMPLQTFVAAPVPNAKNALAQLGKNLAANTNWEKRLMTPFEMSRTEDRISWKGVPFIGPEIQALQEPSGDFLFGEVFPNLPRGKPVPPELIKELNRDNLVFYHWEITSERLKELPQLTQLALLFTRHKQLDPNSAAAKWLNKIAPTLGSCATEITQTAPDELSFARKSPSGLTAVELIALANWLEAPNFPGCDLRLPPMLRFKPGQKPPFKKLTATPAAPAPH
jgi:hypothetical protein